MLIKFDQALSDAALPGVYIWQRLTISPFSLYRVLRNARPSTNQWTIFINIGGCFTSNQIVQPNDEDLLIDFSVATPLFAGGCDDDQPVLNLRAQMYNTVDDALEDWPDLENWSWPAY